MCKLIAIGYIWHFKEESYFSISNFNKSNFNKSNNQIQTNLLNNLSYGQKASSVHEKFTPILPSMSWLTCRLPEMPPGLPPKALLLPSPFLAPHLTTFLGPRMTGS